MNAPKFIRQGDVLLLRVKEIPTGGKVVDNGIVALGEVTGHAHRVVGGRVYDVNGTLFIDGGDECTQVHEQHGPVTVPGKYEVRIKREYDHFLEEAKSVAD